MKKKTHLFLFISVFVFISAPVFAEFRKDEKPVVMFHADTAYTLSQNEWTLDLVGPVTYGILDNLQVGTNFWVWFGQVPNVFAKWNILPEDEFLPALSLGGLFGMVTGSGNTNGQNYKVTMMLYNASAYVTKKISEQFYINGSYSYNNVDIKMEGPGESWSLSDILNEAMGVTDSTTMHIASLGGMYALSEAAKLMIEGIGYFYQTDSTFAVSPGFEWAMGETFRLKLAVTAWLGPTAFYMPYINLKWRIK